MNKTIKTHIIPQEAQFYKIDGTHELHLEAICVFAAIGFFLDDDTYWNDEKVLRPGSIHKFDDSGKILSSAPWFNWHYSPRAISFDQALEEFGVLFETIIKEQTNEKKVILPLSGGIDSRTQATALKCLGSDVFSYSYKFKGGYNETKIAKKIASACTFEFKDYIIPNGYLWKTIDRLSVLNKCYSDFTTPRQMALYDEFASMGDIFSLGHWGDVLFDSIDIPSDDKVDEIEIILKKILKRGGLSFAGELWRNWGLIGDFETYLKDRISSLLTKIKIEHTRTKLRAFKSMYWAPRWTSVNLSVFSAQRPISLPYYDDRMCEFICSVPESFLDNRKLQVAYIKAKTPELAKITWQDQRPFNLYNYKLNKIPFNLPYRISNKLKRVYNNLADNKYVQRNWELQFMGTENKTHLERYLFENGLDTWISSTLIKDNYESFITGNALEKAHPLNILLVLSTFNQNLKHA